MQYLGELNAEYRPPLLYVDAVASIGGAPVLTDEWGIDLVPGRITRGICLFHQLCFLSISETAWEIIEKVDYPGYGASSHSGLPRKTFLPYTPQLARTGSIRCQYQPDSQGRLGTQLCPPRTGCQVCRDRLAQLGLQILPVKDAVLPSRHSSQVPESISWKAGYRFRKNSLVVGGSYGRWQIKFSGWGIWACRRMQTW